MLSYICQRNDQLSNCCLHKSEDVKILSAWIRLNPRSSFFQFFNSSCLSLTDLPILYLILLSLSANTSRDAAINALRHTRQPSIQLPGDIPLLQPGRAGIFQFLSTILAYSSVRHKSGQDWTEIPLSPIPLHLLQSTVRLRVHNKLIMAICFQECNGKCNQHNHEQEEEEEDSDQSCHTWPATVTINWEINSAGLGLAAAKRAEGVGERGRLSVAGPVLCLSCRDTFDFLRHAHTHNTHTHEQREREKAAAVLCLSCTAGDNRGRHSPHSPHATQNCGFARQQ